LQPSKVWVAAIGPAIAQSDAVQIARPRGGTGSAGTIVEHNFQFGGTEMESIMNTLASLHQDESAQGLVEYVLLIALVALAATAGMNTLASSVNSAFSKVSTILGEYVS
jgi:pilus assembly protein Flp/PilA